MVPTELLPNALGISRQVLAEECDSSHLLQEGWVDAHLVLAQLGLEPHCLAVELIESLQVAFTLLLILRQRQQLAVNLLLQKETHQEWL